jgi:LysR family hydrogen peroxide-inducible transcriptional activator
VPLIRARFPRLELLLVEEKTEEVLHRLREGRLDAVIVALPVHDDSLRAEFLFEEPFVLAAPVSHPLARKPALRLADLGNQSLLLLEDGHCLRDQALEVCHLAGAGERTGFRATSLETLRQMVAAEVGITLLPTLAVKPPVAAAPNLRLVPFLGKHPPNRRIAMLWRKSSAMTGFLVQLAGVIRELPKELFDPRDVIAAQPPLPPPKAPRKPHTTAAR